MAPAALPVDPFIPEILARVREARAAVVVAAPGAGKTTRVPPALVVDGPAIVLQPRRVAARSIARRIADEQGWTVGAEVGWHVRFERQFRADTRILLATEGILTARLQQDPLLSGFRTVVLDEFHERSIHADLGIALTKEAWTARTDLRIVVMSATIDASRVAEFLDGCPVIHVPGILHPIDVRYAPDTSLAEAVQVAADETNGQILCFLPGAPEIRRAAAELAHGAGAAGREIVQLHGSQSASEQDETLAPVPHKRVILATNIAETSLTVPGVTAVVDLGLQKISRYDPDRAIDSLDTERISRDSAEQRAGRAGRLGPGLALRIWNKADRLSAYREPEIRRVDLSGPLLDVLAWGGDPKTLVWFEAPPAGALDAASDLLDQLGAMSGGRLTDLGRRMCRIPLHPRLSRILLAARGDRAAALACAVLSERHYHPGAGAAAPPTTTSDLFAAVEQARQLPAHVLRVAHALESAVAGNAPRRRLNERELRFALLQGYPDRVGRRRAPGSPRFLLASGHGAVLGAESGVRDAELVVALDVTAGRRGEGAEARIRLASAVEREWISPTSTALEQFVDEEGRVRAVERDRYHEIVLAERPQAPDPAGAARLLAEAYLQRPATAGDTQLVRRLRFAGTVVDLGALATQAAVGCRNVREVRLDLALTGKIRRDLDRLAPETVRLPGGRAARLEYEEDGSVRASIRLQDVFGVADTPRVGAQGEPILLALLAPNGRPVQITRDLRSFWERTYPEVRKELRGRYPKHAWPENPWTASKGRERG